MECMFRGTPVPRIVEAGVSDTTHPLPALLSNQQSIRLLRYLSPGNPQLPLKFELAAFDLEDCPHYAALSYTWLNPFLDGHPRCRIDKSWDSRTGTIYCNNQSVSILPNLHEALQELVASHGESWYFVDALCINQKDEVEKADQVRLLAKVFTNAAHCICWLGPTDQSFETCDIAIRTFYDVLRNAARDSQPRDAWMDLPIQHDRVMQRFPPGERGIRLLKKAVLAVALLGKRRWFTRAWVIQEYALSRDAFLYCGRHTIDSQHLRLVSTWLQRAGARKSDFRSLDMTPAEEKDARRSIARIVELNQAQGLVYKPSFVDHLRVRYGVANPMELQAAGLLDFLYRCRQCESQDERDRIYALSGMMSMISGDVVPCLVQPDYSLRVFEIFSQITCQFAQHLPTLEFLALAGRRWSSDMGSKWELPSWVPDWGSLPECKSFQSRPNFRAGLPLSGCDVGPRVVDRNILTLHGMHVGTVQQIGSHFTDLVEIATKYLDSPNEYKAASRLRNLWRTLLWGDVQEKNEEDLTKEGIPWGQHSVACDLLWLSRYEYRGRQCTEKDVQKMAEMVKMVSGDTILVTTIEQVITRPKKDSIDDDKAFQRAYARRAARIGERKKPTMVSCWSGPDRKAFCTTDEGKVGAGPLHMCPGDRIYVIRDARLPCLLRKVPGRSSHFRFIGEIYVEGYALGEVLQKPLVRSWRPVNLI